jgi:glutamine synthetase
MAKTMVLPAVTKYLGEVASTVVSMKAAGVEPGAMGETLNHLTTLANGLYKSLAHLEHAIAHVPHGTLHDETVYLRDHVLTAMKEVRKNSDELEGVVADDYWPLPTYREMLFIR